MATQLHKSVLRLGMTRAKCKTVCWVAVTTAKFLRGSVVNLKARSDLAQHTPLLSDKVWDVRKFEIVFTFAQCIVSQ